MKGDEILDGYTMWPSRGVGRGSPHSPISKNSFGMGFGRHSAPPSPVYKGAPWDPDAINEDEPLASLEQGLTATRLARNRFFNAPVPPPIDDPSLPSAALEASVPPLRRQPSRVASSHRKAPPSPPDGDVFEEANKPIIEESDLSDEEGAFAPPPDDDEQDTDESDDSDSPAAPSKAKRKAKGKAAVQSNEAEAPSAKSSKGKGKAPQRNASVGPSGRPTTETNREIERVGQRIQGELAALAEKSGLTYDALLRKIGLSHQGVREPTLANVFRKVHKHRLLAQGEGTCILPTCVMYAEISPRQTKCCPA